MSFASMSNQFQVNSYSQMRGAMGSAAAYGMHGLPGAAGIGAPQAAYGVRGGVSFAATDNFGVTAFNPYKTSHGLYGNFGVGMEGSNDYLRGLYGASTGFSPAQVDSLFGARSAFQAPMFGSFANAFSQGAVSAPQLHQLQTLGSDYYSMQSALQGRPTSGDVTGFTPGSTIGLSGGLLAAFEQYSRDYAVVEAERNAAMVQSQNEFLQAQAQSAQTRQGF